MKRSMHSILRGWLFARQSCLTLFDPPQAERELSVLPQLWDLFCHPIRSVREGRQGPRTCASLFHYREKSEEATQVDWKGLLKGLFSEYRFALFIPSIWSDQGQLVEARLELRTRRMEAGMVSMAFHIVILGFAVFVAFRLY